MSGTSRYGGARERTIRGRFDRLRRGMALVGLTLAMPTATLSRRSGPGRATWVKVGVFKPGALNAITDVSGVSVGQTTVIEGDHIRTGVTAILPHPGNVFHDRVPAAIVVGNGFASSLA